MRKLCGLLLLVTLLGGSQNAFAETAKKGSFGQELSTATNKFTKNTLIEVSGKGFDETVGIYLAYCVVPKAGAAPTPCGGGVNKGGTGESSYWISSNPPPYGIGLAEPFLPGGRFSKKLLISRKIGKFDCATVKCAITVRSDHLHEGDRTNDLFIPVQFKSSSTQRSTK